MMDYVYGIGIIVLVLSMNVALWAATFAWLTWAFIAWWTFLFRQGRLEVLDG